VQVPGGDKDRKELKALAALFVPIQPPLGKFHVPGDTDPGTPIEDFDQWSGVTTLKNGEAVIEKEGVRLAVLGLSLASSRQGYRSGIAEWLERQPKGSLTVVAGHAPDYAITAADLPADLLLAGHTHGGQVRLPFIGPLLTLSKVPKDWARGYTQLANTHLHVSAGIGAEHEPWLPAIRFNCPPEITLIHLVPKS
ncbi:MAG: metallophosphoesterase, partial [Salibacteraceae bacterium]